MNKEMMHHPWEIMWSARQAAQNLMIDSKQMREEGVLASRITSRLDSWFDGAKGALQQDELLREATPHLLNTLLKLDQWMKQHMLSIEFLWPPALWMRSFKESKFLIQSSAINELKRWQSFNEIEGKYFLYKYWDEKKKSYVGPMHQQTGMRGRTALELADGDLPDKISKHAHTLKWKVVLHAGFKAKTKPKPDVDEDVLPPKPKRALKEIEENKKTTASKLRKSGKRRNIFVLRTLYGTGCVNAVQQALEHHAQQRRSNIIKGSSDKRPYSSSLSPLELIKFLKSKYQTVEGYAISTLKPVLGYFIQTPRGRPPTLAELEKRQTKAMKKTQLKRR